MDATGPIKFLVWSRIGMPHTAYVSLVACNIETTEQFPALQAANDGMNTVSMQRQPKSFAVHDCGMLDEKH
jgi:hypothetical protein